MPLRNERQAYWDDIENHIARVQPLTASQALDRVCPDAAAERLALKSRLRDVEEQTRQVHRLRARAAAEAGVLAREADAALDLESKERAFEEARRFVRGRLQNDRPDGQRLGMRAPERLARAALGAPREDRLRAAAPFAVASPAAHADAHRERNERWGSGEVSPLMGGGTRWCCSAPPRTGKTPPSGARKPSASARCTSWRAPAPFAAITKRKRAGRELSVTLCATRTTR